MEQADEVADPSIERIVVRLALLDRFCYDLHRIAPLELGRRDPCVEVGCRHNATRGMWQATDLDPNETVSSTSWVEASSEFTAQKEFEPRRNHDIYFLSKK